MGSTDPFNFTKKALSLEDSGHIRYTYSFCIPGTIGRIFNDHKYNGRSQDSNHDHWSNKAPCQLPVPAGTITSHLVNVFSKSAMRYKFNRYVKSPLEDANTISVLPFMTIDVDHGYHFH